MQSHGGSISSRYSATDMSYDSIFEAESEDGVVPVASRMSIASNQDIMEPGDDGGLHDNAQYAQEVDDLPDASRTYPGNEPQPPLQKNTNLVDSSPASGAPSADPTQAPAVATSQLPARAPALQHATENSSQTQPLVDIGCSVMRAPAEDVPTPSDRTYSHPEDLTVPTAIHAHTVIPSKSSTGLAAESPPSPKPDVIPHFLPSSPPTLPPPLPTQSPNIMIFKSQRAVGIPPGGQQPSLAPTHYDDMSTNKSQSHNTLQDSVEEPWRDPLPALSHTVVLHQPASASGRAEHTPTRPVVVTDKDSQFSHTQPSWQRRQQLEASMHLDINSDKPNQGNRDMDDEALLSQQKRQLDLSQRHLALVIERSIEYTRAADRIQELQKHVETLTSRLTSALQDRDKAEVSLISLTRQHHDAEERLRDMYEKRLEVVHKEAAGLRGKLDKLEAESTKGKLTAIGDKVQLSGEELAALRRNVEEQEVLIKGYQQENEAAVQKIKALEEEVARAEAIAAEGAMRVERQLLLAQEDRQVKGAETATRLRQALDLQRELEVLKEDSSMREKELKNQIDKLRTEKKELEARLGGVDMAKMKEGDVLVVKVKEEMESLRLHHAAMVTELQTKLNWYVENQELLTKNDALVQEQRDLIHRLEERLSFYEGPSSQGTVKRMKELQAQVTSLTQALRSRGGPKSLAAIIEAARPSAEESAIVQGLQVQLERVREDLSRKDDEYETKLRSYQQQYEQLRRQYEEKQGKEESALKLRKRNKELEQQVEELRAAHTKKIRELEARMKAAASAPGSRREVPAAASPLMTPPSRVPAGTTALALAQKEIKRLNTELDLKTRQVAEMHLKLAQAEACIVKLEGRQGAADVQQDDRNVMYYRNSPAGKQGVMSSTSSSGQYRQAAGFAVGMGDKNHMVSPTRSSTPNLVRYLQSKTSDSKAGRDQSADVELQRRCQALTLECNSLREALHEAQQQMLLLQQGNYLQSPAHTTSIGTSGSNTLALQQRLNATLQELEGTRSETISLQRKLEAAELALASAQRIQAESAARAAELRSDEQRAMLRLRDEVAHSEGIKWRERLAVLEQDLRAAHVRIEQLQQELAAARQKQHWSPEAAAFAALERKLDELESEGRSREQRWRAMLEEERSMAVAQLEMRDKKWELILQTKSSEVERFKLEVDSLLQAAKKLHTQQSLFANSSNTA
ncbi:hypothetical protein CEUSTIGMA_g11065.t1 [Chlamydomonas eustigma]|uniref:Centrosomal protein of 162 kDa n=1 Tax=Chlamydomonas eustigma TaxID=1157962 RepID=A0A250XKM0_9CHLO|nr:hypothetical protein CEUSTIGMA_g11065.t1 [Chlamydomonas eustigma]|eukprot:GAX83641.1 hypothetical protein CEUSTIGMA_g11065.t1 [Chlamydomonas eustigma]